MALDAHGITLLLLITVGPAGLPLAGALAVRLRRSYCRHRWSGGKRDTSARLGARLTLARLTRRHWCLLLCRVPYFVGQIMLTPEGFERGAR